MIDLKVILSLIFIFILSSCSGKSEDSGLFKNPSAVDTLPGSMEVELNSIALYSSKIYFPIGDSVTLNAMGTYSDGSLKDITSKVLFTSSDDSKISINAEVATAISAGATTITASLEGKAKTIVLLPFLATITGIELNYANLTLPNFGEATLSVTALYDNGQSVDITDSASFTIDDESIASINNKIISSQSEGSTQLTAEYNGFTAILPIEITAANITAIQVSPILGSKAKGSEQQFLATASLDDGSILDITNSVEWTSSDSSLLSINNKGVASLQKAGTISITANYQSFTNQVNFQVLDKTLSSIDLVLSSETVSSGVSLTAKCIGTYSDNSTLDITDSTSFTSSDSSLAVISNNTNSKGTVNTLDIGTVSFTAEISGLTASKSLEITNSTLSSILVETDNSLLSAGINAYFRATGIYADGSEIDLTKNVTWSLSNTSYGSISNSSSKRGLYTNSFSGSNTTALTITASMNGVSGTKAILLAPGTITSISINPSQAVLNSNQNMDYKAYAHFSDGANVEITNIVTWSSSDVLVGMISNSLADAGRFSALTEGNTNILANYKGLSSAVSSVEVDNGLTPNIPSEGTGLLATYFSGKNFEVQKGQRIDAQINFNWNYGQAPLGVGDNFSVRWTGYIKGKYTGDCTIASRSDDGFRVFINNNTVLNIWTNHAPRWDYNYSVAFVEGEMQEITVEFYENGGQAVAELYWQCPGDSALETIPSEYLFAN